ncbi:MAG: hypothetical protein KAX49_15240 [Halanaerobiales bacterium]|nr:hypothetical protein [Halanaerobiales bacterium]
MDIKSIAKAIDGIKIGEEDKVLRKLGFGSSNHCGIVVVFGASDDLAEFCGAIDDEVGCYDGGTIYLTKDGILSPPEEECSRCEYWIKASEQASTIKAVWCPKNKDKEIIASWGYETKIPHETFKVFEDNKLYCTGIVFSIHSL